MNHIATKKLAWMIDTGGVLISKTEVSATVRKGGSIATIDQFGKVTWEDVE